MGNQLLLKQQKQENLSKSEMNLTNNNNKKLKKRRKGRIVRDPVFTAMVSSDKPKREVIREWEKLTGRKFTGHISKPLLEAAIRKLKKDGLGAFKTSKQTKKVKFERRK